MSLLLVEGRPDALCRHSNMPKLHQLPFRTAAKSAAAPAKQAANGNTEADKCKCNLGILAGSSVIRCVNQGLSG